MPAETTVYKIKYAIGTDEVKAFPAEVSQAGAETIDKVLKEHNLKIKKYAGAASPATGELVVQEKTGETVTLPAVATADQVIGIFSTVAECKVTGAAETIGPGLKAAAWKLTTNQFALLQSNGVNWMMLTSEYKREQVVVAKPWTKAEAEAGVTPSATRPAFVTFGKGYATEVGGVSFGVGSEPKAFYVLPGQVWKSNVACETETLIL